MFIMDVTSKINPSTVVVLSGFSQIRSVAIDLNYIYVLSQILIFRLIFVEQNIGGSFFLSPVPVSISISPILPLAISSILPWIHG